MDETTKQVSELYEDFPYPNHGVVSTVVAKLAGNTIRQRQTELERKELRLLDAGCGTGEQTIGLAKAFPELEVVGIDLSRASLDRAASLNDSMNTEVRFEQRNLMEPLDGIGTFDLITSTGVLHSVAQPGVALRQLSESANPGAYLIGMVYGLYGRWPLLQVLEALTMISARDSRSERMARASQINWNPATGLLGLAQTTQRRRRFGPSIPMSEAIKRVLKGRNEAFRADTYGHVQELNYTWSQLSELLRDSGWSFQGWPHRSGMPDDPGDILDGESAELVRRMPILEQAAIWERLVRPSNLFFIARTS